MNSYLAIVSSAVVRARDCEAHYNPGGLLDPEAQQRPYYSYQNSGAVSHFTRWVPIICKQFASNGALPGLKRGKAALISERNLDRVSGYNSRCISKQWHKRASNDMDRKSVQAMVLFERRSTCDFRQSLRYWRWPSEGSNKNYEATDTFVCGDVGIPRLCSFGTRRHYFYIR